MHDHITLIKFHVVYFIQNVAISICTFYMSQIVIAALSHYKFAIVKKIVILIICTVNAWV